MRRHLSNSVVWFVMSGASSVHADVLYVDANATDATPSGATWCSAILNLQDAIDVAVSGDEIRVADGTYWPDEGSSVTPGDRTATFMLNSGVQIRGGYAGCGATNPDARDFILYETTLSGDLVGDDGPSFTNRSDNSYHVANYNNASAVGSMLEGFTIISGHADGTGPAGMISNQGPAIHIRNDATMCIPGGPTIRDCIIRDNWASHHGAVNIHADAAIIENCQFYDNFAGVRGGGLLIQSGNATVRDCLFVGNTTNGDGGGAWTGHSTDPTCAMVSSPTFTRCTFVDNATINNLPLPSARGGAMFHELNIPSIVDCSFERNAAQMFGGAIFSSCLSISIAGCQFIENTATAIIGAGGTGAGGGGWLQNGEIDIRDCVFERNIASPYGGGIALSLVNGMIRGCAFRENRVTAARGGGIRCSASQVVVADCDFDANRGGTGAGGLSTEGATGVTTVHNCNFRGNNSKWGGGVEVLFNSTLHVANSSFIGNGATRDGGAIRSYSGSISSFTNCTFTGNWADNGNTIALTSFNLTNPGASTFTNCIIWNDFPSGNVLEVFNEDGSQIIMRYSDVRFGWAGTGNMNVIPEFVDSNGIDGVLGTPDDNARLASTSPLIAAGDNTALPLDVADLDDDGNTTEINPFDLDSQARIVGATVDMGAYEWSTQCLPGESSASGGEPCAACEPGTYEPNSGSIGCLDCPAGTFQANSGATSCDQCPTGTTSNAGSATCASCGPGTYLPTPESTECLLCDAGTFQSLAGATECEQCPTGTFSSIMGAEMCDPCDPGTYQPSTGATDCLLCDAGTFQPIEGATVCQLCAAGTFTSVVGSATCDPCAPGTYQPATGSAECLLCEAGTFQTSTGATECQPCEPGTFQTDIGQSSCNECQCVDIDICTIDTCDSLSGECFHEAIEGCVAPASSTWGLIAMGLLLMSAATIVIGRRDEIRRLS